jgi:hypothetical protein
MTKIARRYRRRPKGIDDVLLRQLWRSHMTDALIAEAMGHAPRTLRRRAIKIGLPSSRRKLWETEDQP